MPEVQQVAAHIIGIVEFFMASAGFEIKCIADFINRDFCLAETNDFRIARLVLRQMGDEDLIMFIFGKLSFRKHCFFRRWRRGHHAVKAVTVIGEIKGEHFIFLCLLRVVAFQKSFSGASGTSVGFRTCNGGAVRSVAYNTASGAPGVQKAVDLAVEVFHVFFIGRFLDGCEAYEEVIAAFFPCGEVVMDAGVVIQLHILCAPEWNQNLSGSEGLSVVAFLIAVFVGV
mgnify:CR=1 FL=1